MACPGPHTCRGFLAAGTQDPGKGIVSRGFQERPSRAQPRGLVADLQQHHFVEKPRHARSPGQGSVLKATSANTHSAVPGATPSLGGPASPPLPRPGRQSRGRTVRTPGRRCSPG